MPKILFVGDVHLSDTTPRMRKDDYTQAILGKLVQISFIARTEKYDEVVFVGDIFHKKRPDRNSHSLVQQFMDVLKQFPKPPWSIIGNHDIRGGNLSTLSEQPLGVVFKTGLLKYLEGDIVVGGVQLCPLQFSYENEVSVEALEVIRRPDADWVVRVSHVAVLPGGLSPGIYHMPHIPLQEIWKANQSWDLLINGHVHKGSGLMEYQGKCFINTGSICRGALTEYALDKVPSVVGVEFANNGFATKFHELKVGAAKDVFKVEEKERKKNLNAHVSGFIDLIKNSSDTVGAAHSSLDLNILLEEFLSEKRIEEEVKNKVRELLSA